MKSRAARPDLRKSLVGFLVGGTRYAVGVGAVRQVVNPATTTPIPHAPPFIVGLAEFRSEVIPIVDFRIYLGAPADNTRRTKWIVLDIGERMAGLVVDAVSGVFGTPGEIRAAPVATGGEATKCIVGVASHESKLVYVIDPTRLGIPVAPLLDRASLPVMGSGLVR